MIPLELVDIILTVIGGGGIIGLIMFTRTLETKLSTRIFNQKLNELKPEIE